MFGQQDTTSSEQPLVENFFKSENFLSIAVKNIEAEETALHRGRKLSYSKNLKEI